MSTRRVSFEQHLSTSSSNHWEIEEGLSSNSPAQLLVKDRLARRARKARSLTLKSRDLKLRDASRDLKECSQCGVQKASMNYCGGCRWARYCSKRCQRSHWLGGHGVQCCPDFKLPDGTGTLYVGQPEDPDDYSDSALQIPVREEIPDCDETIAWVCDAWVCNDLDFFSSGSSDWSMQPALHESSPVVN